MKHIDAIQQVEDFLNNTEESRRLSERDRDYRDNKQWTEVEIAKLKARNQAPIVVNRIKPKVEGLKGLLVQRKTDPKAYPRTQKHEKGAEAVTDSLRFVADNTSFDKVKLSVAENIFVEGYGAAITEVEPTPAGPEITITDISWDRYYYDTHSRRLDFADKMYDGIILWLDVSVAKELFDLSDEDVEELLATDNRPDNGFETFDDRPQWVDKQRNRVRICQHFFYEKGVWNMGFLSYSGWVIDPEPSPYLDEYGIPVNPIEAYSANIDRDNNRFGEVRYWIDLQDEMNHRRSKFLHLNSTRQTAARKGAIPDVPGLKRELAKPDGHVEYNGDKGDFEILKTGDMSEAQFLLYQDGKNELDAVSFNAQLSGERQGDLSGRAIANLQQASINELASLYDGIADWEKRMYRQVWYRIRQFWNEEKWIRVLDDTTKMRWVGFNQQITTQQQLEETINDDSNPLMIRKQAAAIYTQMMQVQDPRLQQIVEIRNNPAELDVDIMIDVALDSINMQQEQFEMMIKVAQTRPEIPFEEVLKLSTLRNKDEIIKSMEAAKQANGQAQQQAQEVEMGKTIAETKDKTASAMKKNQEAIQTSVQTAEILRNPPEDPSVVI